MHLLQRDQPTTYSRAGVQPTRFYRTGHTCEDGASIRIRVTARRPISFRIPKLPQNTTHGGFPKKSLSNSVHTSISSIASHPEVSPRSSPQGPYPRLRLGSPSSLSFWSACRFLHRQPLLLASRRRARLLRASRRPLFLRRPPAASLRKRGRNRLLAYDEGRRRNSHRCSRPRRGCSRM